MGTKTDTNINTYRKMKSGKWVVFGAAANITPGATVTVTKKNGETKTEYIESTGKTFKVDGTDMVYGYMGARVKATQPSPKPYYNRSLDPQPGSRYECWECGEWVTAGQGQCWETGGAH